MHVHKLSWHNMNIFAEIDWFMDTLGTSARWDWNAWSWRRGIETDRRIIRDRITFLKKKLETIDKQMATQRTNRGAL